MIFNGVWLGRALLMSSIWCAQRTYLVQGAPIKCKYAFCARFLASLVVLSRTWARLNRACPRYVRLKPGAFDVFKEGSAPFRCALEPLSIPSIGNMLLPEMPQVRLVSGTLRAPQRAPPLLLRDSARD